MKKVGIITIIDKSNCGNRLQNYALSTYCNEKLKVETYTLENHDYLNDRKFLLLRIVKHFIRNILKKNNYENNIERKKNFQLFDQNIRYYKKIINANCRFTKFDYLIVGSDQVWNPNFRRLRDVDVLKYAKNSKKISYAASFGIADIPKKYDFRITDDISKFDFLSVREESAKKIINDKINKQVDVLIDPTMLLTKEDWNLVAVKPCVQVPKKYILCYFLGELSEKRKNEVQRIASINKCRIINLLDKDDPFYRCGPSEFIWLEKNAFLICTDSFHSSVFAIIYNRPFVVFDREQQNMKSMNTRITNLLNKFELSEKKFNDKEITNEQLKGNSKKTDLILSEERKKSEKFLKQALDIISQ